MRSTIFTGHEHADTTPVANRSQSAVLDLPPDRPFAHIERRGCLWD
jgi:hypothetical protein